MASNEEFSCPLCRNEKVKILAVGDCAHAVCHLCSTKMRILCEQNYCAICRQDLPRVYFVSDLAETRPSIDRTRFIPIDETGDCGIYYPVKADWIRRETEKLLRNFCPFCHSEYESFDVLRDHVRRNHRFFYCDLCVEHLNLFPHERKCYSRQDLVLHIRQGDRDDTSFKGHPLCRFCDDHFLDPDQLYKHMRQEHYYCHLCTSDNVYYSTFDLLRTHYRSTHYLCEVGQCKDVQFTNVFSSELEFRAHQAAQHSKSRAEARQLGTIPVEFQSSSVRDRRQQQRDTSSRDATNNGDYQGQGENYSSRNEREENQRESNTAAAPASAPQVSSIEEFPSLGDRSSASQGASQQRGAWASDSTRGIYSNEDFPALANGTANTNSTQSRGIWRENQQQSAPVTQKAAPSVKSVTNGVGALNTREDFPALKGASQTRIPPPVSTLSAWSIAKKSSKHVNATARAYQPQMRMNTARLINDDEDEEYIKRPMSALTSSSAPMASSNITMISSSDLNTNQTNDKSQTSHNQSIPKAQDFPALPSTKRTAKTNTASSGVWGAEATAKPVSNQQKKKNNAMSKKKFMEEVQSMPLPPSLASNQDFPTIGLTQLGQRLITEENEPEATTVEKEKKPAPSPVPQSNTSVENKSTDSPKKKKTPKPMKVDIPIEQKPQISNNPTLPKPVTKEPASIPKPQDQPVPVPPPPPPPGFAATSAALPPPPGFNLISEPQPVQPSYIYSSSYPQQKDEFRAKLYDLFEGNLDLCVEYDKFCQAFSEKSIPVADFLKFTRELFQAKLEEYCRELLVLIPNIEQQNELYSIWKKEIQSSSPTSTSNWTKKTADEKSKEIYQCHLCRQVMFDGDAAEHNSHHAELNQEFPSLPSAAVPLGRGKAKKNK